MADDSQGRDEVKPLKSQSTLISTDVLSSFSLSLRDANSSISSANEKIQLKLEEANSQIKQTLDRASSEIQSKLEEANTQIKAKLDDASTHIQAKLNDGTDSIKKTGNLVVNKLSVASEYGIGAIARALNSEGEIDILALRLVVILLPLKMILAKLMFYVCRLAQRSLRVFEELEK